MEFPSEENCRPDGHGPWLPPQENTYDVKAGIVIIAIYLSTLASSSSV